MKLILALDGATSPGVTVVLRGSNCRNRWLSKQRTVALRQYRWYRDSGAVIWSRPYCHGAISHGRLRCCGNSAKTEHGGVPGMNLNTYTEYT